MGISQSKDTSAIKPARNMMLRQRKKKIQEVQALERRKNMLQKELANTGPKITKGRKKVDNLNKGLKALENQMSARQQYSPVGTMRR